MRVDTCFLWVDTGVTDLIQTGIDCRAWATSSLDSATRVELRRARSA